jgi:diguanylate cyclase (GGDEF)-like protein/PAS domain S-box-containing protein
MLPKKEIPRASKLLTKNLLGQPTGPDEFSLIRKDKKTVFVEISTHPIKLENNTYVLGIARDITEKKKTQQEIYHSQEKFKTIFDSANDCILIHDLEGKILEVNDKACKRLGYSRENIINKPISNEDTFEYSKKINDMKGDLLKKGNLIFESVNTLKNGKKIPVEISSKVISFDGTRAVLSISRDISERKKIEELIRDLAYKDALTDLPNRLLFREHFNLIKANAVRNKKKFALMLIDLDNFKTINDTLGHDIGDRILKNAGKRLVSVLRKEDVVARIGGDEFLLLIPEIKDNSDAEKVAEKLVNSFKKQFIMLGHNIGTTLSLGISIFPDDGKTYDTLTKKADTAMYKVKREGRNNYKLY